MSSQQQPLIIRDWDQGIADSPHKGFGLFRNADIESFPGAVKVNKKPGSFFHSINTVTFTADAASNLCTASSSVEANNRVFSGAAVYFTTTGTLPAGLSTGTVYYLYYVSATTFKVCTSYKNSVGTAAGTVIDITDAGSGTHTMNQIAIGDIKWIINDPRGSATYRYMLDSNGRVWFAPGVSTAYLLHNSTIENVTGALTNASGNGMVIFNFSSTTQSWLFVFRNNAIDVIDIMSDTTIEALSWTNGWKTMNTLVGTNNPHEALRGQDNIIYFTDDRYVGSIKEASGSTFDPASAPTYVYNNQALDLPGNEIAQCLEELGSDLLVGGLNFNLIYPWDRFSDSYNLPIILPEYGVYRMKNNGSSVYILAGTIGNIYQTQGSYVKHVKKLPTYLTNNGGTITISPITWGGAAVSNGAFLFGVGTTTSGNSGLYKLYPDGRLVIDNIPSSGSENVLSILAKNDEYFMGYSGGADTFNSVLYERMLYNNYETVIHSPLYQVATKLGKGAFSRMEVVLAKPASSGNVRISYRADLSSSFTTIDTFTADSATYIFTSESIGLIDIDNIQIQVEMNDGASGSVDVELLEIRLFP